MRTTFLFLFVIISSAVFSQDDSRYRNTFYYSPFPAFVQTFQIGYELHPVESKIGVLIDVGMLYKENEKSNKVGTTADVFFRYYLSEGFNSRQGSGVNSTIYFSPYFGHKYYTEEGFPDRNAINCGLVAGYKFTWSRLVLDFYLGGGYKQTFGTDVYGTDYFSENYKGIAPKAGFRVGVLFK